MSDSPSVSVIVPTFQDLEGVLRCLQTLCRQTHPFQDFEVIVVDNNSTPPIRISDEFPFKTTIVRCETPGSYAARNAGVLASRGGCLAFTDADCVPDPLWIESGFRALLGTGGNTIIGGEVFLSHPIPRTGTGLYQYLAGFQQQENIKHKRFSATANLFCTRVAFDHIGAFDERLLSGGDREWAWRARRAGFETRYAANIIVGTAPRTTLRGAIRQARRVAAGRYHLKHMGLTHDNPSGLEPHRGAFSSLRWILRHPELGWPDRLRMLGAALAIKTASLAEPLRIRLGGRAEHR